MRLVAKQQESVDGPWSLSEVGDDWKPGDLLPQRWSQHASEGDATATAWLRDPTAKVTTIPWKPRQAPQAPPDGVARGQHLRLRWQQALNLTSLSETWTGTVEEPVFAQHNEAYGIDLHLTRNGETATTCLTLEVPRPTVYTPEEMAPRIAKLWLDGQITTPTVRIDLNNLDDIDGGDV